MKKKSPLKKKHLRKGTFLHREDLVSIKENTFLKIQSLLKI